jgi:hypothetical protein
VWDVAGGKERHQVRGETWTGNWPARSDRYLADYAISPDGDLLLTLANEPAAPRPGVPLATAVMMRLRDVDSGAELWNVEGDEPYRAGAFSPDGRAVAAATEGRLAVYEVASGKERARFKGSAWKVALSPDGRVLAAAVDSAVLLWDVCLGQSLGRLAGHQAPVESLAFTPDGKALVTSSADSTALVWDVARLVPRPAAGALGAAELESLWKDLASADAGRAFRAVVALSAAPGKAVPWLAERLRPVPAPDARCVARLIARLDSDDFAVRTSAERGLERLGDQASPALRQALEARPTLEVRQRIQRLLDRRNRLPAEELRLLRGVEVLERMGTKEARALLGVLAKGAAGARLTRDAQAALRRLGR